ncbi:hypothetical protein ACFLY6_00585, partial [Candidatus Dependentiae bacterium]
LLNPNHTEIMRVSEGAREVGGQGVKCKEYILEIVDKPMRVLKSYKWDHIIGAAKHRLHLLSETTRLLDNPKRDQMMTMTKEVSDAFVGIARSAWNLGKIAENGGYELCRIINGYPVVIRGAVKHIDPLLSSNIIHRFMGLHRYQIYIGTMFIDGICYFR